MNFSDALAMLKVGQKICRLGWNGKDMFLFHNPGSEVQVSEGRPLASAFPVGTPCRMAPYVMMKTADGYLVPWLASQTDILAEDWMVIG
jgi:hypothetical protein